MVVYSGGLLSPSLGLSEKEMEFLRSSADQIIHAAVQGHCMNNYNSARQALYLSTQTLVGSIALPRRVPFQLISAPRVILFSGQVEGGPVSLASHRPPTDGSQGVTTSKWASEHFLEGVSRLTGLPVVILTLPVSQLLIFHRLLRARDVQRSFPPRTKQPRWPTIHGLSQHPH
ncbi:hypothetical protein ACHAQJ_005131 [Trichoderma viride]